MHDAKPFNVMSLTRCSKESNFSFFFDFSACWFSMQAVSVLSLELRLLRVFSQGPGITSIDADGTDFDNRQVSWMPACQNSIWSSDLKPEGRNESLLFS